MTVWQFCLRLLLNAIYFIDLVKHNEVIRYMDQANLALSEYEVNMSFSLKKCYFEQ